MLDPGVADDQRVALEQGEPGVLERRKAHGRRELQSFVAQDGKGQLESLGHLALVGGVLRREPEDPDALGDQLGMVIAIRAGLWRTAARAGDRVPGLESARRILVWAA